jgi:glycosyltransferase involved in cell wall biosynthesis
MQSPLVTIVVPVYNYGRYIGQTFESLQAQTYRNWECCVADDGSTDDTGEVVARYMQMDSRIRYVRQENQGTAIARNSGLKLGTGKYVQFLDADDLLEERKIELQVAYMEEHPEVDIVYGGMRYFKAENPEERLFSLAPDNRPWMPEISGAGREVLRAMVERCFMVVNAPLVRRSLIDAVGELDNFYSVEDWDYWVRCAAHGARFQFADLPGTLALVRLHSASTTTSTERVLKSAARLRRKFDRTLRDAEVRAFNRRLISLYEGYAGIEKVKRGRRFAGLWQILKAGRWNPSRREKLKWFFCAAVAPVAPRERFEEVVSKPVSRALANILRLPSGGDA